MKRKIAFLMASIMTLAMVPTATIHAAESISLSRSSISVLEKTMFPEENLPGVTPRLIGTGIAGGSNDDLEYMVNGTTLTVPVTGNVKVGNQFKVSLTNAKWFIRSMVQASLPSDDYTSAAAIVSNLGLSTASTVATEKYAGTTDLNLDRNYNANNGTYFADGVESTTGTYVFYPTTTNVGDIGYSLRISGDDSAVVTVLNYQPVWEKDQNGYVIKKLDRGEVVESGYKFEIPLIMRTADKNVKVTVSEGSGIATGTKQVTTQTSKAYTDTYVNDPQSANSTFKIDRLYIKELTPGTLKPGKVEIQAPSGFYFSEVTGEKGAVVYAESGLSIPDGNGKVTFKKDGSNTYNDIIVVDLSGVSRVSESTVAGIVYIEGLTLNAESNAPFGDIMLSIKNVDSNKGVLTERSFKAGTRVDFATSLKTSGTIPTIVSGRYDSTSNGGKSDKHKAAKVIFEENATTSWWANRETVFTLSDHAKIRKFEITKAENVSPNPSGEYSISNARKNNILVEDNKITLNNFSVGSNKKAKLEMQFWLSVEAGFEGDVTLAASGSGVSNTTMDQVVIAKVTAPVKVTTDVSVIKPGTQGTATSDITIVENSVGALERDKDITLTFNDNNNNYFSFVGTPEYKVAEGDIQIKDFKVNTASNGAITFKIDRASSKASKIVISNIKVGVSGSAPSVSIEPYKLVVGGKAVASNWNGYNSAADQFTKKGIEVPYLQLGSGKVSVTKGDQICKVGDKSIDMGVQPYIQSESNSFMVPLRFIVEGLGFQVLWNDDTETGIKTVGIISGSRNVQFVVGKDTMTINGMTTNIVSPDGKAVKTEIKDERCFIPFRALGDAIGATTTWDEETQSASYTMSK